jgi:hypothetical protein
MKAIRKNIVFKKEDKELSTVHKANDVILSNLEEDANSVKSDISHLLKEAREIRQSLGLRLPKVEIDKNQTQSRVIGELSDNEVSWKDAVAESEDFLKSEGIDVDNISSIQLLSSEELLDLNKYLQRPIYGRIKWDRWDYLFCFGAGIFGGLVDIVAGTPGKFLQEKMVDQNHWIGKTMEDIHRYHHNTQNPAPIDFKGPNFGGVHHRGLSSGHDILRPLSGIKQIKEGKFSGYYFEYGKKILFESDTIHKGRPYTPTSWKDAIVIYLIHMFCDFFSQTSLPIPGTSWLRECSNREVRVFAMDLYKQGINLRHIALQALSPLTVEILLRVYFAIRYRQANVNEDALKLKKSELLLLGHSISTAFNIGKIIIMNNPLLLNVPQVVFTTKQLLGFFVLEHSRNSFISKYSRNMLELDEELSEIETIINTGITYPILLCAA